MFTSRGGATRTLNLRFWRPLLCQLSYTPKGRGQKSGVNDQRSAFEDQESNNKKKYFFLTADLKVRILTTDS